MPVFLGTSHAYRSWKEDHPKGYVQRDEGLKPPSERLRRWRDDHARDEPARFLAEQQTLLHNIICEIADERALRLHATATTETHVHKLFSFRSPACTCGASSAFCKPTCEARRHAEQFITRAKRKMGQQLAQHAGTKNRKWFSRGWDLTPVKSQQHFDYLIDTYLPDHERVQQGLFTRY